MYKLTRKKSGWLCINLMPDRVDVSRVETEGRARPEIVLCDSYRKDGDDVATLGRLRRELKLDQYHCTTLLKGGDYQIVQVEAPGVPANEVKTAVRWRVKDVIDFPVDQATVDALYIPSAEGVQEKGVQMFAVAARNALVAATVNPFNEASIALEVIDIPELAQRNLAARFEEEGRGLAFLTFGPQGGLLTFTCGGELYQHRRIDLVPDSFLTAAGDQKRALYERVVLELQRSLDQFDWQFRHIAVARVIVTPLPGAEDLGTYLATHMNVPITLLDLAQIMDFPRVPELREPVHQGQCVHMIGAALRAEGVT
ncbi:MAG: agglutinin biogenesis protein MshI [Betaproteobacteria bacterium]|nr:agglutinin biogenesis protein MshI [Betaproteobacteria bacterium]